MLPLADALGSTEAERRPGLGRSVVQKAAPLPPDIAVVFSTSGRDPYPVEIAQECAARGMAVIAVTSPEASVRADARADTKLADHATVVLDTAVPPGDVVYPPGSPHTAAVSTILASYAWARLLAELDELAITRRVDLPRWVSANVPGGDAVNKRLLTRYRHRIPELAPSHHPM